MEKNKNIEELAKTQAIIDIHEDPEEDDFICNMIYMEDADVLLWLDEVMEGEENEDD